MRKVFLILLLANVVLFAAMQRGWSLWGEQVPQSQPALNEDQIRLLKVPQAAPVAAASTFATSGGSGQALPGSVHAPVPATAPDAVPVAASAPEVTPTSVVTKPNTLACLEWGDFSGSDLTRANAALAELQLGEKLSRYQVEHDTGYWVYFPPLKNKAAINKKIGELKALGIKEYFVVQDAGRWRNAISLGVFKTQEAAQNFLDGLRVKGVHNAQVGKRASRFKVTIFRLSGVGVLTEVKMAALQKDYSGSELKRIPCELTR